MKEIKGIGFYIPSEYDDYIELSSLSSLSEADIVIFDPSFEGAKYSTYSEGEHKTFNGKACYNHESSTEINEHCSHWQNEIKSYLNRGKTLFIILSEKESYYIQTGRKEFSGTGKNRQTTNIVTDFSNYNFLPTLKGIKYNVARGNKIISNDPLFKNLLDGFTKYFSYETYLIIDTEFKTGLCTKNKDKILGGVLPAYGGQIVFLPKISFDIEEFWNNEDDDLYWTNEALIIGKKFTHAILEIDNVLQKDLNKTPRPEWLNDNSYALIKSTEINNNIGVLRNQIAECNTKIQTLQDELIESEKLNDLLFETGKPLEEAVIYALKILGFTAENYNNGVLELDQVIISPEGIRYIGECEGKDNKAIDISKFRQLQDSLNEDYEREEVNEKAYGILFGNPYRLSEPSKRIDAFTDKCLKGAEREKIGLVETVELYRVAKYLLENKDERFKKKCRETLFRELGKVIKFPSIKNE